MSQRAHNRITITLLLAVGVFGVLAFVCASCSHPKLPAEFPVGPSMEGWLLQHEKTEIPKLTEP